MDSCPRCGSALSAMETFFCQGCNDAALDAAANTPVDPTGFEAGRGQTYD